MMLNERTGAAGFPVPTVLVVDDEQMIRWSIEQTLTAAGYEVRCAGTGAEGLVMVKKIQPGLVFLDLRLPDANGLDLIERIKQESAQTAVIVMTAFEEDCTAANAIGQGAAEFLSKPFNFDELPDIAGRVLERTSAAERCAL